MQPNHAAGRPPDPELVVVQGPQQGARITLAGGCHSVGSALSNDIVLLDPALTGQHFTIHVGSDGAWLTANDGPIHIGGQRQALQPGAATARCTGTVRFEAGDTAFLLSSPGLPSRGPGRRRVRLLATGAASFAAFALLFTFTSTTDGAVVQPLVGKSVVAEAAPAAARPSQPARDFAAEAKAHLTAAQLDTVTVTGTSDGTLTLSGVIPPAQEAGLREMQRWFDGAFGAHTLLVDQVRVVAEKPPLAVQAAWTGAQPYVIDGNGQKLFLGARLADGWMVSAITPDTVLLQRGARSLVVHF